MQLPPNAHKQLWEAHTWAGVCTGLILFVMFLTGDITLFHEELEVWEHPSAQVERSALPRGTIRFSARASRPESVRAPRPLSAVGECTKNLAVWQNHVH